MMHQQTDKKLKFFLYFFIFIFLSTVNNFSFIKNKELLSKVKSIEVVGLSKNLNSIVKKKFDSLIDNNIFTLNKENLENVLNQYNYLQNYNVYKLYPSKLLIKLHQTDLLAITIKNNEKYLIGSNGKLINPELFDSELDVPNVFGNFTSKDFIFFVKMIHKTEFDYQSIKDIFFFPSGRWDIKTKDNITIKLPQTNIQNAFIKLEKIINNQELSSYNVIDLRIANRVILSNE